MNYWDVKRNVVNGGFVMNFEGILDKHKKWLEGEYGGEKANLSRANLCGADLCGADLRWANLCGADLSRADLSRANLSRANLCGADLSRANLSRANLSRANLSRANLSDANLSDANLSRANLSRANLSRANLSRAKGLVDAVDYLEANFERTKQGYVVYKTFGSHFSPSVDWNIEPNSVIEEVVNPDPCSDCGCGVNVATLNWVKRNIPPGSTIWKCIIEWPWLAGVIVPYNTDGKIRASRVRLLEVVK